MDAAEHWAGSRPSGDHGAGSGKRRAGHGKKKEVIPREQASPVESRVVCLSFRAGRATRT